MKIYTKIRIDLKTGRVLEEESFEYSGPLALCALGADSDGPGGSSSGGSGGWGSDIESSYEQEDADAGAALGEDYSGDIGDPNPFGYPAVPPTGLAIGSLSELGKDVSSWSTWDIVKAVLSGVYSIGALTTGNPAPAVGVLASLANAAYSKGWTTAEVTSYLSKETGVSEEQVSSVVNSSSFQSLVDETSTEDLTEIIESGGLTDPATTEGGWDEYIETETGSGAMNIEQEIQNLLGTSLDMTAYNNAMTNLNSVATDIAYIGSMAELSGITLSDTEQELLDTMRTNAITLLKDTVTESTLELAQTEIANMVSKGVWEGTIGAMSYAKIFEDASDAISSGTTEIESTYAGMALEMIGQNRSNQLEMWGQDLQAQIANVGSNLDVAQSNVVGELASLGVQQDWNTSQLGNLTSMWNTQTAANTELSTVDTQVDAYEDAQDSAMWGNIGAELINAWA